MDDSIEVDVDFMASEREGDVRQSVPIPVKPRPNQISIKTELNRETADFGKKSENSKEMAFSFGEEQFKSFQAKKIDNNPNLKSLQDWNAAIQSQDTEIEHMLARQSGKDKAI